MDVISQSTGSADPIEEVRRLRRQLARERARREAAERIGERATEDFHDSVRELRKVQAELLERADQTRVVDELSRSLRQDIDPPELVARAAESVGRATAVDRCDVLLVDAQLFAAVHGSWSGSRAGAELSRPDSVVELPSVLTALLPEAARDLVTLRIEDVEADVRLPPGGGEEIVAGLGVRAFAAVPVSVGDEVVGWLLLRSVTPRAWQVRDIAICEGLSRDMVTALIQLRTVEQQRESVRRLEELDRAKDSFIASVSHELRTPLTSIVGYLEMLTAGTLGELDNGVSQGVEIIERNVGRLRSLVEDLLTLSEYDAGQVELDLDNTDLTDVVSDRLRALGPETTARHLEVVVVSQPDLPHVLVDHDQIQRVVDSLLSNAVKFSHDGGRITVRLSADDETVSLSVTDTGIGIPRADQRRLFSRFFRSRLTDEEEIQGFGLGLALVKKVVEQHGGTVALDSTEGEGTTVVVRLPRTS